MKKLLFLFFISVFVFACEKKERFLDNDVSDADQSEEQKDIDEIPDEDVEENWHIAPVVKCEKDSDCPDPDKEFCDPYGECQCRRSDDYVIRYKGKCIHGLEGNKLFCNGNSSAFKLKHSVPRKGSAGFVNEKTDLVCICNSGYYGLNCEYKNLDYSDKFPVGDEYFLPEPNCKKDEDCSEGMKCSKKGFCYCDGEIEFTDPVLKNEIILATGKIAFTGEDLLNITKLTLGQVAIINNMKCLPNLRALQIFQPNSELKFEELSNLDNLQYLVIFDYNGLSDFSPILKLKKLLFLGLDVTGANYKFLEKIYDENHIEMLYLDFFYGDLPHSFDFLNNFKKLVAFTGYFGQSMNIESDCEINLENLIKNKNLSYLKISAGKCKVLSLNILSELRFLHDLTIGNLSTDGGETKKNLLSDFPVLKNITKLFIDSTIFDEKIIDKFPELTFLYIWQQGLPVEKLDFMEGLVNLQMFSFSDDVDLIKDFDDKKYSSINMKNLRTLSIYPFKSRNYEFLKKLKHVEELGVFQGTSQFEDWDSKYVKDYEINGSVGDDYSENLLYLMGLADRTYHLDNVKSFRKNCDKGGAVCNKKFREYFYPEASLGYGFSLCPNPIDKDDEDVKYLVEKGVGLTIGNNSQNCEALFSDGENITRMNHPLLNRKQKLDFRMDVTDNSGIKWISK
ncbi:MAG TPA: hypothetical protein PLB16_10040 [bacterium]|nr:hypothetical protein [bacterium]